MSIKVFNKPMASLPLKFISAALVEIFAEPLE
jgi:hypothetical protein